MSSEHNTGPYLARDKAVRLAIHATQNPLRYSGFGPSCGELKDNMLMIIVNLVSLIDMPACVRSTCLVSTPILRHCFRVMVRTEWSRAKHLFVPLVKISRSVDMCMEHPRFVCTGALMSGNIYRRKDSNIIL